MIVILIIFVLSLFRTAQQISAGRRRLAEVKNEVNSVIKQKDNLGKEIKERESLTFLETEARNQLNLIKPGERIVILPKKGDLSSPLIGNSEESLQNQKRALEPNWVKWKRLFFD